MRLLTRSILGCCRISSIGRLSETYCKFPSWITYAYFIFYIGYFYAFCSGWIILLLSRQRSTVHVMFVECARRPSRKRILGCGTYVPREHMYLPQAIMENWQLIGRLAFRVPPAPELARSSSPDRPHQLAYSIRCLATDSNIGHQIASN